MHALNPAFGPVHVKQTVPEIDLVPAKLTDSCALNPFRYANRIAAASAACFLLRPVPNGVLAVARLYYGVVFGVVILLGLALGGAFCLIRAPAVLTQG